MLRLKKILPILLTLLAVFTSGFVFNAFDIKRIEGNSMEPTFKKGDCVIISLLYNGNKLLTSRKKIFTGDIVVFKSPLTNELLIKRVIATEGDPVQRIDETTWEINGRTVLVGREKIYLFEDFTKVPKRAIFLLGDNIAHSTDSRDFGFLPLVRIEGKVMFRGNNESQSKQK